MAYKRYQIPEIGNLVIYKRRGVKAIKLSVSQENEIKVTMPNWTPYQVGIEFVKRNRSWINTHMSVQPDLLKSGLRIGKAHTLSFINSPDISKISSRISNNEVRINLPVSVNSNSNSAQSAAKKAALRTLRKEAEKLLPIRLDELAKEYGFSYREVAIKQLKSRWGSCNSNGDITLNFYLMQLPWEMIDYVILHELTHTKVLAHGKKFWDELRKVLPEQSLRRKQILTYKPVINSTN